MNIQQFYKALTREEKKELLHELKEEFEIAIPREVCMTPVCRGLVSIRLFNILKACDIKYLEQIKSEEQFLKFRNAGQKSLKELKDLGVF